MSTTEHAGLAVATQQSVLQLDRKESKEGVENHNCGSSSKKRWADEEEKNDSPARGRMKKFRSIAYIYKVTLPVDA